MKTRVQFLIEAEGKPSVFAFFPEEEFGHNWKSCYSPIGQHGACAEEYAEECIEASPEEYDDLKQELESFGYELEVLNTIKSAV